MCIIYQPLSYPFRSLFKMTLSSQIIFVLSFVYDYDNQLLLTFNIMPNCLRNLHDSRMDKNTIICNNFAFKGGRGFKLDEVEIATGKFLCEKSLRI